MQYELIRLKEELGITFVYVTHDQEEALTMSDVIVVMNQGYIQQIGTPEDIYNEPQNAFVADFIGESNIISATMVRDKLVNILGTTFDCVDVGFGENQPVDVVIRPEDLILVPPEKGLIRGKVISLVFKGVHYEMEIDAMGYTWLVQSTRLAEVGKEVGLWVDPFNIQIMKKPETEAEEAFAGDRI
jgi:spermidine/putrescine transport system ATP-binding protein